MNGSAALQLAAILFFGIAAQWLAWRTKAPAIIMLIIIGFVMGPVTGILKPDELFGDILLPVVSFSVAIILYEGGLNLNIRELKHIGGALFSLISIGAIVSWGLIAFLAHALLGFELRIAVLFGALLVVTGPTVIIPIINQIKPSGRAGKILKWEGIVIDPIGASLAVIVFEIILEAGKRPLNEIILQETLVTVAAGIISGAAAAGILIIIIKKYWAPDFLQNPLSLVMVLAAYLGANYFQEDAGLLAATVMGIILASQKIVDIRPIVEFKENLRVLLISALFIVLAARLPFEAVQFVSLQSLLFILLLVIFVRPVSVYISLVLSKMKPAEKMFLASLAPRGIVAAAVASVFEIRLREAGVESQGFLYMTFIVIIGTIIIYGLSALPVSKKLGIARLKPQGLLVAGASKWVREILKPLKEEKYKVVLVDSNSANVTAAKIEGFEAVYGSILDEHITEKFETEETGRLLAVTANDEVNMMSAAAFSARYGSEGVYRLYSEKESVNTAKGPGVRVKGRLLFGAHASYKSLEEKIDEGWQVKKNAITKEFSFEKYLGLYSAGTIQLFIITKSKEFIVLSKDNYREPKEGETLISVVPGKQ